MTNETFTPKQLAAKGFKKSDIKRALVRCESRCNAWMKRAAAMGKNFPAEWQRQWDAECAHWDHLKLTIQQFA